MNNVFYCYSKRLRYFLLAYNEKSINTDVNKNTKKRYWVFNKSERLDKIIEFYNRNKHNF